MKPTSADLWLWERVQARNVPSWARALDTARGMKTLAAPSRERAIAESVHMAINARAGLTKRSRTLANAITLIRLVRSNQGRGYQTPEPSGAPAPCTLAEYMRAHAYGALNGKAYSFDKERAPHYRRWLRRLERAHGP